KVWINQASRKIQQAAKQHLAQMKKRYGRFNRHRLTMDAELSLVRFVGSSKQKVFVCSRDPAVDVAIDAADAPSHWQNTRLLVDGHAFEAGSDVGAQLDKWSKVQALRTK
ncbi:MAG: hypothetical protein ABW163_09965, partial [Luteimonas sp.]